MSGNIPRFISEKDLEARKQRDEAEGKNEEPYDPRPLYDRLQAERARKQEEYESSNAFKNQIHRLDPEESAFLAKVEQEKMHQRASADREAELLIQEAKVVGRSSLLKASAPSTSVKEVSRNRPPIPNSNRLDQKSLLAGIKRKTEAPEARKPKKQHCMQADSTNKQKSSAATPPEVVFIPSADSSPSNNGRGPVRWPEARARVGVLPGLDGYGSGDDKSGESAREYNSSDCSSDDGSCAISTDVEDAAVLFTPLVLTRFRQKRESE